MKQLNRWFCVVASVSILLLGAEAGASEDAASQQLEGVSLGAVGGYNPDLEAPLLGVEGRFTFYAAPRVPLSIQPGFNYFFMGSSEFLGATARTTLLQFEVNALVNLELDAPVTPYAGVGPAMIYVQSSVSSSQGTWSSESNTDLGFNLLAGAAFELDGPLRPFGQFRVTFLEGNSMSLMVGLSYVL